METPSSPPSYLGQGWVRRGRAGVGGCWLNSEGLQNPRTISLTLHTRLHPQPQLIWISCGKLLYSTSEHDCTLCPTVSEDISARRPGEAMSASNPGEAMSARRPGCAIFVRPKRICKEQGKYINLFLI